MSESAARQSGLGNLLAWNLPEFWLGLGQRLDGASVETLIENGAYDEDEPLPQVVYHFHDPTRPWGDAGLLGGSFPSSIRRQQAVFVPYMWQSAREDYLNALLETDPADRLRLFSQTFESIGHIVHFVQDAASPAHTRDDPHLLYIDTDRLHSWADQNPLAVVPGAVSFSGDLSTPTLDFVASRPVARIIDATEADRGVPAWSTAIGVAEYSNSQFLSDDRTFGANGYTFPRLEAMEPAVQSYTAGPLGSIPSYRRYLQFAASSGEGETDYLVAAQTPLFRRFPTEKQQYATTLDPKVLADYGRKLLPRAVDYSTTAIDYFFRGRIAISAPDRGVYGRVEYEGDNESSFQTLRFKVQNISANGEEADGEGTIRAVVHYRTSSTNVFEDPANGELSEEPHYVVSNPVELSSGLSRSPRELRFDFPNGIPANAADVWLMAVYQGKLGGEADAVLVGGMDLVEPQPIDFANMTDYDCSQDQFYYVANLPSNDPSRDLDNGDHLEGPWLQSQQYRKVSDFFSPIYPNSLEFDFFVSESRITGATLPADGTTPVSRYVVLVDGDYIVRSERGISTSETGDSWSYLLVHPDLTVVPAMRNDLDRSSGLPDALDLNRRAPDVVTVRGWTGYNVLAHITSGVNECGRDGLEGQPPDLTLIPGTLAPEE
jgi:hypothetical protein